MMRDMDDPPHMLHTTPTPGTATAEQYPPTMRKIVDRTWRTLLFSIPVVADSVVADVAVVACY